MKAMKGKKKGSNISFIESSEQNYGTNKATLSTSKSTATYKPTEQTHGTISNQFIKMLRVGRVSAKHILRNAVTDHSLQGRNRKIRVPKELMT